MYHLITLVHIFHSLLLFPGKILGESYVSVMLIFIYYRLVSLTAKKIIGSLKNMLSELKYITECVKEQWFQQIRQ